MPLIRWGSCKLHQTLINLLSNAVKYHGTGRRVVASPLSSRS